MLVAEMSGLRLKCGMLAGNVVMDPTLRGWLPAGHNDTFPPKVRIRMYCVYESGR